MNCIIDDTLMIFATSSWTHRTYAKSTRILFYGMWRECHLHLPKEIYANIRYLQFEINYSNITLIRTSYVIVKSTSRYKYVKRASKNLQRIVVIHMLLRNKYICFIVLLTFRPMSFTKMSIKILLFFL